MVEWREIEKLRNGARYRKFVNGKPTNGYKLILGADPIVDEQVGASADDCLYHVNAAVPTFSTTSSFCLAGYRVLGLDVYGCGMRFQSVAIPQGATIGTAKMTFRCGFASSGVVCRTRFHGEDVDDAAAFSTRANYLGRARTSAVVDWDGIAAWILNTDYEGPEIKTILQEIVNRVGWASGNDMVIFWDDHDDRSDHNDGAVRWARSYNGSPTYAPKIHIEYTTAVVAPTVTKGVGESNVEETIARLNGEVTNTGGENPTVHIYWGTSDGETTPGDWDHDENLGALGIGTFYKDISGLTRGTKYYYRCFAENSGGSSWSDAVEFTTLLEKPVGASNAGTGVGVTVATLNGTVTDDGGGSCQYRFRYKKAGGDYVYTDWTGAKTTGEAFSEGITGLDAGSTYYFNARVKNSQFEGDWGAELTFTTGAVVVAPTGTTDPATLVADIEATLNGTVTGDGGEACEVRFQYGLTGAYGTNTAWQPGKLTNDTFSQKISGLTPNTLYHFRAQVKNSDSTVNGADRTFTTEYFPTPFLTRLLRDVFGGGADIGAGNPLPVSKAEAAAGQTPVGITVTAANTEILAANASRKVAVIVNDSDAVVYLAIGVAAQASKGIRLNANGGNITISRTGDIFSTEAVYGILAAAGNKNVTAQELQ